MTQKTGTLDMGGVPMLHDNPEGSGSMIITDWDDALQIAVKAHGKITQAVLNGDTTLETLVRPKGDMPEEYNVDILKLADDGIVVYPKPDDKEEKKVYNAWMAYGKLLAKKDKANSLIFTAIWKRIGEDLKLSVESQKKITKGDGRAVYSYMLDRFVGGGASSLRIKLAAFNKISFEDGASIHTFFSDVLKAQNKVNSHGLPKAMKTLYEKIMSVVKEMAIVEKRPEAVKTLKGDFDYDLIKSLEGIDFVKVKEENSSAASTKSEGSTEQTTEEGDKMISIKQSDFDYWVSLGLRLKHFIKEIAFDIKHDAVIIPDDQACGMVLTNVQNEGSLNHAYRTVAGSSVGEGRRALSLSHHARSERRGHSKRFEGRSQETEKWARHQGWPS